MPKLLVSLRGPNVLLSLSLSPYALLRPLTLKKKYVFSKSISYILVRADFYT